MFTKSSAPHIETMRIGGTVRLAQAIQEVVFRKASVNDACNYLIELLPLLLDADGVLIQITASRARAHPGMPERYFSGNTKRQIANELTTDLFARGSRVGKICLFYAKQSAEIGLTCQAILDFVGSCLSRILDEFFIIDSQFSALTPAEKRVLCLFSLPTDQILARLHISRETFRVHCKRIYKKLGVHTRREAMLIASHTSLLDFSETSGN